MTLYVCPHLIDPHPGAASIAAADPADSSSIRQVCRECYDALNVAGERAWLVASECMEDCAVLPDGRLVMRAPYCSGPNCCDNFIARDGMCMECWGEHHLVACRHCDDMLPAGEVEEYGQVCRNCRPLPYTSYERGPL